MKNSVKSTAFTVVNKQVLEGLKKEGLKWFKPWRLPNGNLYRPCNWVTGRAYNGVNAQILTAEARANGYTSGEWATYKNIQENGGQVRKGEKSTGIVYWVRSFRNTETGAFYPSETALRKAGFKPSDLVIDDIWSLRYYNVFNVDQADGLEPKAKPETEPQDVELIPTAESIYNNYSDAPTLKHGGDRAYYAPTQDHVQMPEAKYFVDVDSYYKTLFHELVHSTGHESRLKREGVVKATGFGSELYSKEELVAEIGAWYLTGLCNLDPKDSKFNSQAYINGWVEKLENKEREVVYAMGQAQKAVNRIIEAQEGVTPPSPKKAKKEPVLASNQVELVNHSELVNYSELKTQRVDGQAGANVNTLRKHLEAKYRTELVCEMVWNSDHEYKEANPVECIKVDGVNYNIYITSFGGELAIGYSAINAYHFVLLYRDLTGEPDTFKFTLETGHSEAPIQRAIAHGVKVTEKYFWDFVTVAPYGPKLNSMHWSLNKDADRVIKNSINENLSSIIDTFEIAAEMRVNRDSEQWRELENIIAEHLIENSELEPKLYSNQVTIEAVNFYDIRNIFNASYRKHDKVTQFGQTIDNPNLNNLNDPTLIDTLDILHDLYDECIECYDMTACKMHDLEGTRFEWIDDLEETAHINTYNWSAPLTNDLDFKVYESGKRMYILLSVQNGYSDARCGYMVEFLFIFDNSYSDQNWGMIMSELPSAYKSFSTSNDYTFDYNMFNESGVFNISKWDASYDEYDVYVGDYDDCEEYANKIESELESRLYSNQVTIDLSQLGSSDLESYEIVLREYNENARGEEVMETGFNTSSGYVYIALENGIQIASCFGQDADFIVYDYETGEEYFLDTYEEAEEKIEEIQEA